MKKINKDRNIPTLIEDFKPWLINFSYFNLDISTLNYLWYELSETTEICGLSPTVKELIEENTHNNHLQTHEKF